MWSQESEELLLLTAAHESRLGDVLVQYGNGIALGIFQIEPDTLYDNYTNYLNYPEQRELKQKIAEVSGVEGPQLEHLKYNYIYGTIHARLKYYRDPKPIPPAHDTWALAEYAKRVFNSEAGAATPELYFNAYRELVFS